MRSNSYICADQFLFLLLAKPGMLSSQAEIEEYYGYNSILTEEGKRIRRMRRTEASNQKLVNSRLRQGTQSRSISSRRSKAQNNQSSKLSLSINTSKGKLKTKCSEYLKKHFYKQRKEEGETFEYGNEHQTQQSKNVLQQNSIRKNKEKTDIKDKFGEYYMGIVNKEDRQSAKKRSNSKKQSNIRSSRKVEPIITPQPAKPVEKSDYFISPDNTTKRKLKKLQKSFKQLNTIEKPTIQSDKKQQQIDLNQKESTVSRDLKSEIKSRSKIRMKIKSSSKLKMSKLSNRDKEQNSIISNSIVSNSDIGSLIKKHDNQKSNSKDSDDVFKQQTDSKIKKYFDNDYGMEDSHIKDKSIDEQQITVTKKSLVHLKMSQSQVSDIFSSISSHADKVRSKIKERKQKSKFVMISQLELKESKKIQTISLSKEEKKECTIMKECGIMKEGAMKMTKKSTAQTQQTNKSISMNRSNNSNDVENKTQKRNKNIIGPFPKKISQQSDSIFQKISIPKSKLSDNNNTKNSKQINPEQLNNINQNHNANSIMNQSNNAQVNSQIQQKSIRKIRNSTDSYRQLPLTSACPSARQSQTIQISKVMKKKSLSAYTFNDVVQNIQEHQIRLGFLYLFVDNTKTLYESPLKFQRYERLCFLMLKKYFFQKNRIIKSLKGEQNCFTLTDAQIPSDVLRSNISRQQVRERLSVFIEQSKQIFKQLQNQFYMLSRKYSKDKLIKLQSPRDNFSKQIMKLLMQQLTKLYQQLQGEDMDTDHQDANEHRIIEIVEIMFLISELGGRSVKSFDLLEENVVDFDQYYSENYQKIMETAEYFEKMRC